jgi:serine/threonine protein phosphatase PrpC
VWVKRQQYPGLAISRSIGDDIAHSIGVTHEPDIKVVQLERKRTQYMILAGSDGLWNVINNTQAKNMSKKALFNCHKTPTPF